MSYSQPNRPCSTTGGRECAREGVLRVSAKVAIEELQKNCELESRGDKGESDAHAAHIQSANRTARRHDVMMIHHGVRIPQHKDGGCGQADKQMVMLFAQHKVIGSDPYP